MTATAQTFGQLLEEGRRFLTEWSSGAIDARVLLQHCAGLSHAELIAADDALASPILAARFRETLARRASGEPVAHIVGRQEFYGRDFIVNGDVLIPRPETEMLVDAALAARGRRILDLGTGSGCLLLTALLEKPGTSGVGIDRSPAAIAVAERNRAALGIDPGRAVLKTMAFADAVDGLASERFDLILSNPPYIPSGAALPASVARFEPAAALFAGADGLDLHHEVAAVLSRLLADDGAAFIEIGHDQGETARAIYAARLPGRSVQTKRDLAGHPRMVAVLPAAGL